MKKEYRSILFSSAILFALLFNAVYPGVARADGGATTPVTPQAPVTTDTSVPSTQAPASTDTSVPSTQAPISTDTPIPSTPVVTDTVAPAATAAPTDVTPSATDTATVTAAATATTQALNQVPDGTQITVVDGNGNVQPLATQAAANIIATGDPIWCPAGASPIAGTGGCTASYTDLYSLVNAIVTSAISQPNQNGTIWISAGTDTSASNITIDGSALTTWANYSLTLQGGWNGSSMGTISGTSDFSKSIGISNWKNDVAVNDVTISNTTSTGLTVDTTGNISVNNVASNGNTGKHSGAVLDNTSSTTKSTITVDNSTFNNNSSDGLNAHSNGNITLTDVIANNNRGTGAYLDNSSGNGNVSIDPSTFNNNFYDGLDIYSSGYVSLTDITADYNGQCGYNPPPYVFCYNGGVLVDNTSGTSDVSIGVSANSSNDFSFNYSDGLDVFSNGSISLDAVTADWNYYGTGAYLDNSTGSDSISLTGTNEFNYNNYDGLDAVSNGNITLDQVTANYNDGNGALLGPSCFGECPIPNGDISVSNSTFGTNSNDGLAAISGGNLTLTNVTTSANASSGAYLDNSTGTGSVSVSNSSFDSNVTSLDGQIAGLDIYTNGNVILNYISVSNNGGDGLGAITSGGNIAINNVTAASNSGNGFYLDPPSVANNITITCSNIHDNGSYGVNATLGGTLTLNDVTFANNVSGNLNQNGGTLVNNSAYNCNPVGGGNSGLGGLPIHIIPITGGLDCTSYSANEVVLPNQDHVLLPCPTAGTATLTGDRDADLPSKLDSKYTFVSAFDAEITPALDGLMIVSFKIPAGQESANFTILYWDGSKWEDLGGTKTSDGFFQVQTDKTGTFVLVTK